MNDPRDAYEREEVALEERLHSGELSQAEFNEEMRDLGRAYHEEADRAADEAYWAERERW